MTHRTFTMVNDGGWQLRECMDCRQQAYQVWRDLGRDGWQIERFVSTYREAERFFR